MRSLRKGGAFNLEEGDLTMVPIGTVILLIQLSLAAGWFANNMVRELGLHLAKLERLELERASRGARRK